MGTTDLAREYLALVPDRSGESHVEPVERGGGASLIGLHRGGDRLGVIPGVI